jgi:hypothetical protein
MRGVDKYMTSIKGLDGSTEETLAMLLLVQSYSPPPLTSEE